MKKILFLSSTPINFDLGLLLIRVIIGLIMAFYGYEKLINFTEMSESDFWTKNINFMGMSSKISLGLTIFAELFCSLLLILGLFTRLSLVFLLFTMGYIFTVVFYFEILSKGENGFTFNDAFVYFIIYLGLFFTGSGKYSLDYKLLFKEK